jgi:hypothetical protein
MLMMRSPILLPVIVLTAWTMVMWAWMYWTRIPAIIKMKMKLDPYAPRGEQMNTLPSEVRWKADNYNHLMEQPTVFYAVGIVLAILGAGDGLNNTLAWIYVALRIIHSIVQASVNNVMVRFVLFLMSSLVLVAMTARALLVLLN